MDATVRLQAGTAGLWWSADAGATWAGPSCSRGWSTPPQRASGSLPEHIAEAIAVFLGHHGYPAR